MSFVTQDDVFAAVEPVLHGVFEEFADGRSVSPAAVPAHSLCGVDAEIRRRQAGPAQSDRHRRCVATCSRATTWRSRRSRARPCAPFRRPAPAAQPRSFFDKLNDWARSEMGAPGLGYIVFEDEGGALTGKGPIAKFIPADALAEMAESCRREGGRRAVLLGRRQERSRGGAGRAGAHPAGPRAGADQGRHVRVLLDRRLPDV